MADLEWQSRQAFADSECAGMTKLEYAAIHIFAAALTSQTKLIGGHDTDQRHDQIAYMAKHAWEAARILEIEFIEEKE